MTTLLKVSKNVFGQHCLKAVKSINTSNTIYRFSGPVYEYATRTSLKIDRNKYVEDKYVRFLNYSTEPNAQIKNDLLIALKPIECNDEITINL